MTSQLMARRNVWNMDQKRRTLGASNHIRKTCVGTRSKVLNRTTLTPVPRLANVKENAVSSTMAVLDFPKSVKPSEGGLFPLSTKDLGATIANETEVQLNSLKLLVRFDIHGQRREATEKNFIASRDITIKELMDDLAIFTRLVQDKPLRPEEDLMVFSIGTKCSYMTIPRDRTSDIRELSAIDKLPKFEFSNFLLGMKSNVTDGDIESSVLAIVDDLCQVNKGMNFPDSDAARTAFAARKRFRTAILSNLVANLKQKKLGSEKKFFKIQPENETKVSFL